MSVFLGSWKFVSNSDSFDDYLKELGINVVLRKLSKLANPVVTFSRENDLWTMKTDTAVKSASASFKLDQKFEECTIDGRTIDSLMTITEDESKNSVLRHEQVDSKGVVSVIDRSIENNIMKVRLKVNEVTASAEFKKCDS